MSAALLRLVSRQGGVLTRAQALEHCSPAEVRARLRRGEWHRTPWRGIYLDGELPPDPALVVRAAALWLGGDLVACHSTAALLWGFDITDRRSELGPMHFLGPDSVDNRLLAGLQVHPSSLGVGDAVQREGVWCTPPARTACDVVRAGRPIDGLATLDSAVRSGRCTRAGLTAAAERQAGLRGVVRLRALVPHADGRAESPMESRMRWRFIDGGLPAPDLQVRVDAGYRWREMDTAWRTARVGAEFDGLEAHMTPEQLRDDRRRHNWLTERRWTLLHFTAADVYRSPAPMVEMVRRQLVGPRTIMAL